MLYFFGALFFGLPALLLLCQIALEYQHFTRRRSAGLILHRFGISSLGSVRTGNWGTIIRKALLWCGAGALYLFLFELPWFALFFLFMGVSQSGRSLRRDKHAWLVIAEHLLVVGMGLGLVAAPILGVVEGAISYFAAVVGILLLIWALSRSHGVARGTRIHETGIDTDWGFFPWELIRSFRWYSFGEDHDLVLRTTTPVVRILGMQLFPERVFEILIPVPDADKPVIEDLLAERKGARDD